MLLKALVVVLLKGTSNRNSHVKVYIGGVNATMVFIVCKVDVVEDWEHSWAGPMAAFGGHPEGNSLRFSAPHPRTLQFDHWPSEQLPPRPLGPLGRLYKAQKLSCRVIDEERAQALADSRMPLAPLLNNFALQLGSQGHHIMDSMGEQQSIHSHG